MAVTKNKESIRKSKEDNNFKAMSSSSKMNSANHSKKTGEKKAKSKNEAIKMVCSDGIELQVTSEDCHTEDTSQTKNFDARRKTDTAKEENRRKLSSDFTEKYNKLTGENSSKETNFIKDPTSSSRVNRSTVKPGQSATAEVNMYRSTVKPGRTATAEVDTRLYRATLRNEANVPTTELSTNDSDQDPHLENASGDSSQLDGRTFNQVAFSQSYTNAYYKQLKAFQRSGYPFNFC